MVLFVIGLLDIVWERNEPGFHKKGGYPGARVSVGISEYLRACSVRNIRTSVGVECSVCRAIFNQFS